MKEVTKSRKNCRALRVCQHIIKLAEEKKMEIKDLYAFLLAALSVCIMWKPMLRKRISRATVEDSIGHFHVIARLFAYSVIDQEGNKHWQKMTARP